LSPKNERLIPDFVKEEELPPCAETDPEAFFSQDIEFGGKIVASSYYDESGAKKICGSCSYRVECLLFAIKNNEMGIWGGTTENERTLLKRKRNLSLYIK
jgi:WhiB family redox-sensing transcriptional regulator